MLQQHMTAQHLRFMLMEFSMERQLQPQERLILETVKHGLGHWETEQTQMKKCRGMVK